MAWRKNNLLYNRYDEAVRRTLNSDKRTGRHVEQNQNMSVEEEGGVSEMASEKEDEENSAVKPSGEEMTRRRKAEDMTSTYSMKPMKNVAMTCRH